MSECRSLVKQQEINIDGNEHIVQQTSVRLQIFPTGCQATTEESEVGGGCVELHLSLSPTQTCLLTSRRCLKVRVEQGPRPPLSDED